MRACLVFIITILAACAPSALQRGAPTAVHTSLVRGTIQNESGWRLPGISLLAMSNEHRGSRLGLSDSRGNFIIRDLRPGTYRFLILRGSSVVSEQKLHVPNVAVQNLQFIVPDRFGDRPSERNRPVVDRALVRTTGP